MGSRGISHKAEGPIRLWEGDRASEPTYGGSAYHSNERIDHARDGKERPLQQDGIKEKQDRIARGPVPSSNQERETGAIIRGMKEAHDKGCWCWVGWGIGLGTMVGAAVSSITKDPIWVGLGVAMGTGLGAFVGAVLHAKRT